MEREEVEGGRVVRVTNNGKTTQQCCVTWFYIYLSEEHDVKPHTEKSKRRAQI